MNKFTPFVNKLINVKYLILFTLFAVNLVDQPAPEVTIEQGRLSGLISSDGTYFEYLGIPYATTISSARFQDPFPPPSWNGVFKANEDIYTCPQTYIFGVRGSEDCLKMNIYVPALSKGPFPVMFNIHGGGFIVGSGGKAMFGPEFLVQQQVILVTFNYRLGALGFLCLGIKEAPGNAGLKDQLAALRWVKKNIAAFGGDPDNVTIFGGSSGAMSVSLFLVSDATNGLFQRSIMQSGSAIMPLFLNKEPVKVASRLAKSLGYNTEDPNKLYEIFSKLPINELLKLNFDPFEINHETDLFYLPCVEKHFPGKEPFLTDLPYNIMTKKPRNVTIISGITSNEGLFFSKSETENTLSRMTGMSLVADELEFENKEIADKESLKVKEFYFSKDPINLKKITNVSNLYSHVLFEIPMILETEVYLQNTQANIYNYYFNYSGGRNFLKSLLGYNEDVAGVCHGDELMYLFKGRLWPSKIKSDDQKMIYYMTKMWANFAKYGDPTPESAVELPFKWSPSRKNNLQYLYIEETIKIGPLPNLEAYKMWKDIYAKYRRKRI